MMCISMHLWVALFSAIFLLILVYICVKYVKHKDWDKWEKIGEKCQINNSRVGIHETSNNHH